MIEGNKITEEKKKRHYYQPEDYTMFDHEEFKRFTPAESLFIAFVVALLIFCVIEIITFSN